jgi:hypothetical protein
MRFKKFVVIFSSIFVLVLANTALLAATKDNMTVTAGKSTLLNITPFVPGNAQNQWFYNYTCVQTGTSLSDTLPISFTLDNARGDTLTATVTLNANGNPTLAGAISFSPDTTGSFNVTGGGSTVTEDIVIATGNLSAGTYDANVQISTNQPAKVTLNHDTIHVRVVVADNCSTPPTTCFITDSSFNPLLDCSGNPVALEANSGGTFQINFNAHNVIVATNPGQFYYNLIWTNNTGADHNITLTMSKSDDTLVTTGTNALHAFVFESADIDPTQPLVGQFDAVNTNGVPCGTGTTGSTTCKSAVTIHAGETLWVTWHLAYAKIGQSTTSVTAGLCPVGGDLISATCLVSDSDTSEVLTQCTSQATGYLKRQPH